jgi:hypothetical protein
MSEPRAVYAVANLGAIVSPYKSHTEERWAAEGALVLLAELGEQTAVQLYEPVTFHLPGSKYTPDFQNILESGRIVYVEVKGTRKMQSYRDSRAKLRAAAELHPWFTWLQVDYERGSWIVERING